MDKIAALPTPFERQSPQWYFNREFGWLAYNRHVFHQAQERRNPLLERVRFDALPNADQGKQLACLSARTVRRSPCP